MNALEELEELLVAFPTLRKLNSDAWDMLLSEKVDRAIALETLADVVSMNVGNPSAFVFTALKHFPGNRGERPVPLSAVDEALAKYPHIHLDDQAMAQLQGASVARALEVIEDMASKNELRNPSAFVSMALRRYPEVRGPLGQCVPPVHGGLYLQETKANRLPDFDFPWAGRWDLQDFD